ncbi:MAG: hypothetical protein WC565_09945 [Parcubacteria group bacterium]|jgi:hypothetical protein
MPCLRLSGPRPGFICYSHAYCFEGYHFENHSYLGPVPLRKDGEPSMRTPKGFWESVERWKGLSAEERERCREA